MNFAVNKKITFVLTILFLFVSSLGIIHFSADTPADGEMLRCFMPGMETVCDMNALEHISAWQNMFTSVLQDFAFYIVSLLLLAGTSLFLLSEFYLCKFLRIKTNSVTQSMFFYYKKYIAVPSQLQRAFSNGTLHPKLFFIII